MRFADDHDLSVDFVLLSGATDGDISNGMQEHSWGELAQQMLGHQRVHDKKKTQAIIPALFKEEEDWVITENSTSGNPTYRNDSNVKTITLAIFDLDKKGAKEKAENLFKDFESVIYSTFSYSEETPYKYRIVLPLEEPIKGEEWPEVFHQIKQGIDADSKCGNLSRMYFMPSHPADSNIKPVTQYNSGKLISKEDLLTLADEYMSNNGIEKTSIELNSFNSSGMTSNKNNYIQHFSEGKINKNQRFFGELDNSYEGMLERPNLKNSINKYLNGDPENESRHYFALSVTNSEYKRYGEKADLHSIVQFIYRASQEFSSPISHGDTGQEMLEIAGSAIMKQAPHVFQNHFNGSRGELAAAVTKEVEVAQEAEETGEWSFSGPEKAAPGGGYSYTELKHRHLPALKGYFTDGDVLGLTKNILDKEAEVNGKDTDLIKVSEMIHKAAHGFFTAVQPLSSDALPDALKSVKSIVLENIDDVFTPDLGYDKNDFEKFMTGVMSVGQNIALNNSWTITNQEPNDASLSR